MRKRFKRGFQRVECVSDSFKTFCGRSHIEKTSNFIEKQTHFSPLGNQGGTLYVEVRVCSTKSTIGNQNTLEIYEEIFHLF